MSNKFKNGLFIFRRDLRIVDNLALNYLSQVCENIYTIFIFTPEQVGSGNRFKSDHAVQFMIESLEDLAAEIRRKGGHLHVFYGKNAPIVANCIHTLDISVVAFNRDITPYALQRDTEIAKMCEKKGVFAIYEHDYFLHEPGSIKNGSGEPYQKFTPYYEQARGKKVAEPRLSSSLPLKSHDAFARIGGHFSLDQALRRFVRRPNPRLLVKGGREVALKQMTRAAHRIKHYNAMHNDLTHSTSELSAAIKFGCVSIREVHKAFRSNTGLIRQLYWRDFYANILHHFPRVIGHSLKPNYDKIRWHHNAAWFQKWCSGTTGFPIVDAGMRQMNATGYMHNRARLIVASFLVKTLLIDWREGERYFAQTLTDYDVANNNGNWQWISGGGADSQPYFRVFNPWRQAEENDPDCEYTKRWIPELKDVPARDIFRWDTEYGKYKDVKYPKPMVDYAEQRDRVVKMYEAAFSS